MTSPGSGGFGGQPRTRSEHFTLLAMRGMNAFSSETSIAGRYIVAFPHAEGSADVYAAGGARTVRPGTWRNEKGAQRRSYHQIYTCGDVE
jgi:hypothetical protein